VSPGEEPTGDLLLLPERPPIAPIVVAVLDILALDEALTELHRLESLASSATVFVREKFAALRL
jgi:hypothetical protein